MCRHADHDVVADDAPRDRHPEIGLSQMQHRRLARRGDVGAVVDGPQLAVTLRGRGDRLEQRELLGRLQPLLPQLDDVDAATEDGG
jgi:hypothetical protein